MVFVIYLVLTTFLKIMFIVMLDKLNSSHVFCKFAVFREKNKQTNVCKMHARMFNVGVILDHWDRDCHWSQKKSSED